MKESGEFSEYLKLQNKTKTPTKTPCLISCCSLLVSSPQHVIGGPVSPVKAQHQVWVLLTVNLIVSCSFICFWGVLLISSCCHCEPVVCPVQLPHRPLFTPDRWAPVCSMVVCFVDSSGSKQIISGVSSGVFVSVSPALLTEVSWVYH